MTEHTTILPLPQFFARLFQESQRAMRYNRQFCLFYLKLEQNINLSEEIVFQAISPNVRLVDFVGWDRKQNIYFLFPEIAETAQIPASRLMNQFMANGLLCRGALAVFPIDGTVCDTLLAKTQAAADNAKPGEIASIHNDDQILEINGSPVIARDPKTKRLFALVENLAQSTLPVLIQGETGVGKEIVAHALHHWSRRMDGPLISVNCAAMPENLLESELFGHVKGAFSGAVDEKQGLFETAQGGSLFLDEISEAPIRIQAGLLRVLETKRVRKVGANVEKEVDVRILAATNRNLPMEVEEERFRRDLYYRLCAATIYVPLLAERFMDLPALANVFLSQACKQLSLPTKEIKDTVFKRMQNYAWPGNIRELKNLMEYIAATIPDDCVTTKHLPTNIREAKNTKSAEALLSQREDSTDISIKVFRKLADEVEELERRRIREALIASSGVKVRAAKLIGMPLRTMISKINKYDIRIGTTQKISILKGEL